MRQLTQTRLRELLHYDPKTGLFVWRTNRRGMRTGVRAGYVKVFKNVSYLNIRVDGRHYRAGRLAFLYMTGEWPPDEIDHRDCDGLNNRWENLRAATRSQNRANSRLSSNSLTGYKGVTYHRKSCRYRAWIQVGGKGHYLGRFDTPEEAHAAYVAAAKKYFGEFARAS
mgnify:CR=1 FL=1